MPINHLLLFLLNVAAIGFLFVYEVARILFDIQDVGVGRHSPADSRLLRAEPIQQANVLNFASRALRVNPCCSSRWP